MSLIQIPKIEYITLEQFIPNWTEMIKEMDEKGIKNGSTDYVRFEYARTNGLDYENTNCCLVGEAHHSNNDYADAEKEKRCIKCYDYCIHSASSALDQGKETFQAFKLDLFTHMLETHPQLMIK